jgi:arylsulfatase
MTHSSLTTSLAAAAIPVLATLPATAQENIRGATTAPTTAPGYDHRDQFAHLKTSSRRDNLYPVLPHPDQDAALATARRLGAKRSH